MTEKVNAGKFAAEIATGGWPIWITLKADGREIWRGDARELPSLDFVIQRARIEARAEAQRTTPKDVQKL